ncbi:MAG: hypothetical protein WDO73_17920 [Ignavibacteriota bacterium]
MTFGMDASASRFHYLRIDPTTGEAEMITTSSFNPRRAAGSLSMA